MTQRFSRRNNLIDPLRTLRSAMMRRKNYAQSWLMWLMKPDWDLTHYEQ